MTTHKGLWQQLNREFCSHIIYVLTSGPPRRLVVLQRLYWSGRLDFTKQKTELMSRALTSLGASLFAPSGVKDPSVLIVVLRIFRTRVTNSLVLRQHRCDNIEFVVLLQRVFLSGFLLTQQRICTVVIVLVWQFSLHLATSRTVL